MNIILWAGFLTCLLLISPIEGYETFRGTVYNKPFYHHSANPPHYNSAPALHSPPIVQQKPSLKHAVISGLAQGTAGAVANQGINRIFGSGGESSHGTVNHYYSNQVPAAPGAVLITSSGPTVHVVDPKPSFPTLYIILIVVGCIVAVIVVFLTIKLAIR